MLDYYTLKCILSRIEERLESCRLNIYMSSEERERDEIRENTLLSFKEEIEDIIRDMESNFVPYY